jgi:hypothetical protein
MPTDKPVKKNDHLLDDLRYLAMYGPRWYPPRQGESAKGSWAKEAIKKKQRLLQRANSTGRDYVRLGPGGS